MVLSFAAMKLSDFNFELPEKLIAQYPPERRGDSRLLLPGEAASDPLDTEFCALPDLLQAGDLLVMNDTRVLPARLYGEKESGGKVELLLERIVDENTVLAQIRASKAPQAGTLIRLQEAQIRVLERQGGFYLLQVRSEYSLPDLLHRIGHMPLPPYIQRADKAVDQERYQTVFARYPGAVAAPTAGLHMTNELLARLEALGIGLAKLTLHVGAGTFQPLRVEDFRQHRMHREWIDVKAELCQRIYQTRQQGGRIIALGTTALRALEAAAADGDIRPFRGDTEIFIYPGYEFRVVDRLITNFHLPKSSLLLLVCAFAGRERMLHAYAHAIKNKYRFYSYGDAMLIDKTGEQVHAI